MGHRQPRRRPDEAAEDSRDTYELCREQTTRIDPVRTGKDHTSQYRRYGQADQGTWADPKGHGPVENQQLPEDPRRCHMAGES